eukprot:CAMPEP_0177407524 /NCGR_PEP_ID=MMETSP0368-20130122/63158_1 /TAXON_ID=447022 ORGANISM="Scrippsiella hangoei-like, Strain SHHI-4" /NCGR_SAMPLE_ID=MMETSP0368 /ASSEMBLY_ACC=CAM_ASM_000363 /LENGTH=126 /DNA_ID=CAMNT_0018876035 /DNA_START=45 /DNA_END=423 /DNA_ORIENTATION=+
MRREDLQHGAAMSVDLAEIVVDLLLADHLEKRVQRNVRGVSVRMIVALIMILLSATANLAMRWGVADVEQHLVPPLLGHSKRTAWCKPPTTSSGKSHQESLEDRRVHAEAQPLEVIGAVAPVLVAH